MGEAAWVVEETDTLKVCADVHARYSVTKTVSDAQKVDIERTISQLGTLAMKFASIQQLLRASGLTKHAADLLSILGRLDEGLKILSEMETLCHESGDCDGVLECAWGRGKVLAENNVHNEDAKAALMRCLAFAEENKEKFSNIPLLNDTIINAKYYLGKTLFSLREYRDAIPLLVVAEDDDGFDKASVHFNLGMANLNAARFQITDTVHKQKCFELALFYFKSSYRIGKARDDAELAFLAARKAGDILFEAKDYGQALEVNMDGALLASAVGNRNEESKFRWNGGQMLFAEKKYKEALEHFVASLEAALQTAGPWREACIEQAFTWVHYTSLLVSGYCREEVETKLEVVDLAEMSLSRVRTVVRRAEAMMTLGRGKFILGQQAVGGHCLQEALAMLDEEIRIDGTAATELHELVYKLTVSLAAIKRNSGNTEEAAMLYNRCGTMVEKPLERLQFAILEGDALGMSNHFDSALKVLTEALGRYRYLLESEQNAVAGLLCVLGHVLYKSGQTEEAISKLQEACRIWEEKEAFDDQELPRAYMLLFELYILKQDYWRAFEFAKHCQPVIEKYHHKNDILMEWKALQGTGYMLLGDYNVASSNYLSLSLAAAKLEGDWRRELRILGNLASAYRGQKKYRSALDKYEDIEELLSGRKGYDLDLLGAEMSINRGEIYLQMAFVHDGNEEQYYQKALQNFKNATELLACHPSTDNLQARAYASQARVHLSLGNVAGAGDMAEKALKLAGQDRLLVAKVNYILAHKAANEGALNKAIEAARKSALLFADVQMELQDLDYAWVTLFGSDMKQIFIFLQRLYYFGQQDYTKALLWAERGRMRLFHFKVESYQTSQQLDMGESRGGPESSANHKSWMALDTGAGRVKPQLEAVADDIHQLQLNLPASREGAEGAVAEVNALESGASRSDLIKDGIFGIFGNMETESSHLVHDSEIPVVDISRQLAVFKTISSDKSDVKQRAQEENASRLEEEAPPELFRARVCGEDPLWFDKDDNLAEKLIFQTLDACGKGAAIVEYMYAEAEQLLITYVLVGGAEHFVHYHRTNLKAFFEQNINSKIGKSLRLLVMKTLTFIMSEKSQDKALVGLQILQTLLLAPIREHIVNCSKVIFSPHEVLNCVPFAALYDGERFLIQEKSLSIIPSIRALHHCFIRQDAFEVACKNGTVGPPFVAGNPEPMGLGLGQLKRAAKEAEEVAELLGVPAVTGRKVTKDAVIKGLASGCLSVLVTHGIVDAAHPHGALVLQGRESEFLVSQINVVEIFGDGSSVAKSLRRGILGQRNLQQAIVKASDVITAEEITAVPGGIPAGLVVLSACQTGLGEVTSEGVLGLGRALLQAGAAAAVVSLWEVDDESTKDLVTGLFTGLVKDGNAVAEALQSAMLCMLNDGRYRIYHWAPFVVFGSPFMKFPKSYNPSSLTDHESGPHQAEGRCHY